MFWTTVYKPSQRAYHEREKRINGPGDIVLSRRARIFVSTVLADPLVGLTEGDDGIGKVTFMDYDIGCFDEDDYKFIPFFRCLVFYLSKKLFEQRSDRMKKA